MGSLNVITVYRNWSMEGSEGAITDDSIESFLALPNVVAATPLMNEYGILMTGKYAVHTSIYGIRAEYASEFDLEVEEGEGLSAENKDGVIMGSYVRQQYFDPRKRDYWMTMGQVEVDPLNDDSYFFYNFGGEMRKMKARDGFKLKVVGLLKQYQNEQDYCIYMDIDKLNEIKKDYEKKNPQQGSSGGSRMEVAVIGTTGSSSGRSGSSREKQTEYQQAWVKAEDIKHVTEVSDRIKEMGFNCYSLGDMLGELNSVSQTIQLVLGSIGAVSLLVAAIGIANTMIMSIYERTREIGIMKVIGARVRDINRLFLFEAAFIGLVGGVIGLLLSTVISFLLNNTGMNLAGMIGFYGGDEGSKLSVIPLWLYLVSLVFSSLIGLLAGIMPARRASSKISALEAIRNEG
jgi:putative ABC transport system permease protein